MDTLDVVSVTKDTLMTIRYTYGGACLGLLEITGEKAEHGPYMLRSFQEFLEGLGYVFEAAASLMI